MKKLTKVLIIFISLLLLFCVGVSAEDGGGGDIKDILDEFSSILPEDSKISMDESELVGGISFESILGSVIGVIEGRGSEFFSFFLMVFGFAVIYSVSELAFTTSPSSRRSAGVGISIVAAVTIYPRMYALFESVRESLVSISSFFGAAVPIMTAITTATGSVKSAGVQAMNMNMVLGAVGAVAVRLLLPLSLALFSLALASSFGEGGVLSLQKGIKNTFTFGLGLVTAISSAAIAMQTVVASASDSAALRAARYAAGSLIPVVGSSVSAALSTLAGGLAYAKSTVGTAAIFAMLTLALTPLVSLLFYRLAFSVSIFFLEFVDNPRGVRCFSAYRTAIDAIISVYVMSTLVCIIQIIIFMKGGAGVV